MPGSARTVALVAVAWACAAPGAPPAFRGQVKAAGTLSVSRVHHTATLLADGRVLVVGGRSVDVLHTLNSTELFDPKTRSFRATAPLKTGRSHHTATLLDDGRVLVVGGATHEEKDGQQRFVALGSAELYDPTTDAWLPVGSLTDARNGHTATKLKNGAVLIVGGAREQRVHLASVEQFDPQKLRFSPRRPLAVRRWLHVAALLSDGSVVVVGGRSNQPTKDAGPGTAIEDVERYDASSGVWHRVPSLSEPHQRTAVVAAGNVVTVVGGQTSSGLTNYVETWQPGVDGWTAFANHLSMPVSGHTATQLPGGDLLVVGGEVPNAIDSSRAQVWDAKAKKWCLAGELVSSRKGHTATRLPSGGVLVVGGSGGGIPEALAELWTPAAGPCLEPPGVTLELGGDDQ